MKGKILCIDFGTIKYSRQIVYYILSAYFKPFYEQHLLYLSINFFYKGILLVDEKCFLKRNPKGKTLKLGNVFRKNSLVPFWFLNGCLDWIHLDGNEIRVMFSEWMKKSDDTRCHAKAISYTKSLCIQKWVLWLSTTTLIAFDFYHGKTMQSSITFSNFYFKFILRMNPKKP